MDIVERQCFQNNKLQELYVEYTSSKQQKTSRHVLDHIELYLSHILVFNYTVE